MYWSRKFRTTKNCQKCNYIGIPKNTKNVCGSSASGLLRIHGANGMANCHQEIMPDNRLYENNNCNNTRCMKTIIKSGVQPTKKPYSYSYKEHLRKKQKTYEKNLGPEYDCSNCRFESNTNTFNPNNKQYHQEGAVESSTRLDRLKLNTLTGNYYCPPGTQSNGKQAWESCYAGNYLDEIRSTNTYNSGSATWRFNDRLNNYNVNKPKTACLQEKSARRKSLGNMMGLYKC
jgi:hypothetical protein